MARLKWEWPLVALLCVAYIIVCIGVDAILHCDFADHLTRAYVAADLMFRGGEHFGDFFRFEPVPVAYVLGDLILAVAVHWFGTAGATVFWTILNLAALPLAVAFYLHVTKVAAQAWAACILVALYFAADSFFIAGFLNFHLAVAMVVFSLAVAQQLRVRFSAGVYAAYLLTLVLGFLMHLSFVLYGCAAVGVTALWRLWRRETTFAREALLLVPFGALAGWHFAASLRYPTDPMGLAPDWGALSSKLRRLDWALVRLHEGIDVIAALVVAGCAAWIAARRLRARAAAADPVALELLLLGLAFVAAFVVMPYRVGGTTYLDVRALALASPLLALGLLILATGQKDALAQPGQRTLLMLACTGLAVLNLALLYTGLKPWQQWLTSYRALTVSVPARSKVLAVHTFDRQGQWRLQLHAAPLAVVADRNAIVPNMFGADRGEPMKYFSYVKRGYDRDLWVLDKLPMDWHAVACGYEFILVTEPFSATDFGVPVSVITRNTSGALLRIDATACARLGG